MDVTCFIQVLGELGGLPAAGFTRYDQKRVSLDGPNQFVSVLVNRQISGFVFLFVPALL